MAPTGPISSSDGDPQQLPPAAFLQANSETYEWLVEKARAAHLRLKAEVALRRVQEAAEFASHFHPGRFADGAIENVAFEVGAELERLRARAGETAVGAPRREDRRRLLHVASVVVGIGGHTRMLHDWMRQDRSTRHSVVVSSQGDVPVPAWLEEATRGSRGEFVVLPPRLPLREKALQLRGMARRTADMVVLHHAGSDPVPTVAFATHDCPPVAVLNHADHEFWLASSVADIVINLRAAGAEHTRERRYVLRNTVIPIALWEPAHRPSRREARRALGMSEDEIVLLSVGRARKYRPCGPYDFVSTVNRILDREPRARMFVVGESAAGISPHLRCALHDRLHFAGSIEDPSLYRAAADVYLESFPFGSQTALLEAALAGLPVVPAYAPLFPLLVANDDAVKDLLPNPGDEQEYIDRARRLVQNRQERLALGATLRERLLISHVGQGWVSHLTAMYRETDGLIRRPEPIPVSPCLATNADISLGMWHVMADGRTPSAVPSEDVKGALLRHASYVARWAGNHAGARRYAWRAVLHDPRGWPSWRVLVVALLGRAGKLIRRFSPGQALRPSD